MAISISGNTISSNEATTTFYTNGGTYVQEVNNSWGRRTNYPSFNAAIAYDAWRYSGQMSGAGWRQTTEWGTGDAWTWTQTGAGSYGMSSNGRYYAPVSGYYQFGMVVYYLDDANSYSYTHMNFGKNGGLNYNNSRHGHSIFNYPSHGSYSHGINMESIIYCDQGQYVCPQPYLNGASQRIYMGHFGFFGHLCP